MQLILLTLLLVRSIAISSSTAYYALMPCSGYAGYRNAYEAAALQTVMLICFRPPYYGDINTYDPQSSAFEFYGNFSFHVLPDNTTDYFCFESGPVALMNNTNRTIFTSLQCHAQISRLLLLRFDIRQKTFQQSSWALDNGVYYYLHYDSRRQRLFGLRDLQALNYVLEEYDSTTLEKKQEYTRQNTTQYGYALDKCSVFDPDENWIVEIRTVINGQHEDAYYLKMDLNLVGKKHDIVTEFQKLSQLESPYTMTYDARSKLVLLTWKRGVVFTETMMARMNPHTSQFEKETVLLKTPFGWWVPSVQALFDEPTRQVIFLIKQTDLQQTQIIVWSITVEFDTMKIIEQKKIDTVLGLQAWTFFTAEL